MILFNDLSRSSLCLINNDRAFLMLICSVLRVLFCNDWALIATCGKALINDYDYDL